MLKNKSLSVQIDRRLPLVDKKAVIQTQKSQIDLPLAESINSINSISGITVKIKVNARIKCKGFLNVLATDSVILLDAPIKSGIVYCQQTGFGNEYGNSSEALYGNIPVSIIQINRHSWNIYLQIVDILMDKLKLLEALLYNISDESAILCNLVNVLRAKEMLPIIVYSLFELEYNEKTEKGMETELFRSSTPSMILLGSLFSSDKVTNFSKMVVERAIQYVKENPCSNNYKALAKVLDKFINFIIEIPSNQIPYEIILSLNCMLKTHNNPIMLGSIFFLRLICPALIKQSNLDKSLITLAKCIQLIANHIDPAPENFMYNIKDNMKSYQGQISAFLIKVALYNYTVPVPTENLINEAALIYKEVATCLVPSFANDIILHEMKRKLGPVPSDANPVPLNEVIDTFKNKFSHLV